MKATLYFQFSSNKKKHFKLSNMIPYCLQSKTFEQLFLSMCKKMEILFDTYMRVYSVFYRIDIKFGVC